MAQKWNRFDRENPPEQGRLLWYFFETVGVFLGEFRGGEAFGGSGGFLTGDVTHWMYAPNPKGLEFPWVDGPYLEAPANVWLKFDMSQAEELLRFQNVDFWLGDQICSLWSRHNWSIDREANCLRQWIWVREKNPQTGKFKRTAQAKEIRPLAWIKAPLKPSI